MAQSVEEIQQEILDVKNQLPELSALEVLTQNEQAQLGNIDSTSKVAVWRKRVYMYSSAIRRLQLLFDSFVELIKTIVKENRPHNEDWYKAKTLAFQYGHPIINDDEYADIDVDAQIVKQCAVKQVIRDVVIKVATLNNGELVKISDPNIVEALGVYLNKHVKDAGTKLVLINKDADLLKLIIDVYYNPLLMRSDGSKASDSGTFPIYNPDSDTNADGSLDAVRAYLQSLEFDGEYLLTKAKDKMQKAEGVIDVKIRYAGFRTASLTNFQEFDRIYLPLAGYMKPEEIIVNYNLV